MNKLYLIDPHRQDLYDNNIFDGQKHYSLKVYENIKKILRRKGIIIDTIDLHDIRKADKIFFFDFNDFTVFDKQKSKYLAKCIKYKIPKGKMNLIIVESPIIKPYNWLKDNHGYFSKIYTWNDSLIDNKKYFHYLLPINNDGFDTKEIPFSKKKFLIMINANKVNYFKNELYSLRRKAIRYFEKRLINDFDLYGFGWDKPLQLKLLYSIFKGNYIKIFRYVFDYFSSFKTFPSYKGTVIDKYPTLSQYKYCLCFENMGEIEGNITEKIFDCLKAKCVPIYYGGKNISNYIPKDIFIDFEDFEDFNELTTYLYNINETAYQKYIHNINRFIKSNTIKKWSSESYCESIFLR